MTQHHRNWEESYDPSQRHLRVAEDGECESASPEMLDRYAREAEEDVRQHMRMATVRAEYAKTLRRQADIARRQPLELTLAKHRQTISDLTKLPSGWDNQGAEPPSTEAAHTAWSILTAGLLQHIEPSRIDPSVEGGIVLEYHGDGKRYCLFECYNEGDGTIFLYSLGNGDPRAMEIGFDNATAPKTWSKIEQFRHGEIHSVDLE